ncbi:MAG: hypothetical protein R2805_02875 [Flavobacterium sp.]|jgi:hypothetical protein|uniref:hypothetical protein n=1 Tax=Flavobacterium sp. TaxID=239 RepID=UPI003526DEBC
MKKFHYKPTKLFYSLIGSLVISLLFSPIAFGIVGGLWCFYGLINLGNMINEENQE